MEQRTKLKILHVLKSSIYSGAENVVITIIRNLSDEFEFLYVATDGTIHQVLEREKIPFVLLERFNRKALQKAVSEYQPDIIHAHDFSAAALCASLTGRFRLISHLHYDPPWVRHWNVKTIAYLLCYPRIDRLLSVSEKSFENMIFAKHYVDKMTTIGNPVDGSRVRKMAELSGADLHDEGCDLIFVGRLVEQKNPQRFIRLIAALRDRGWRDIRAWMLGSGELEQECHDLLEKLRLEKHIEMKGFQDNPYPFIRNSRIMCITSRWEGFGLVAIEANLLGIPVLSTDNAGCSEILGADSPEICRSDEEFLDRIQQLHQSDMIYKEWKEWSLKRGDEFDNIQRYMRNMACIYRNEVSD